MTDLETCSWCTDEVPYSSLREAPDGALLCRECKAASDDAILNDILSAVDR